MREEKVSKREEKVARKIPTAGDIETKVKRINARG